MTEKQVQNTILREFGTRPDMRLWRANTGAAVVGDISRIMAACRRAGVPVRLVRFGVPGAADLSGILLGGQRFEIEVKSASGRQTPDQKAYQAMIERMGGLYVLAYSVQDVAGGLETGQ